MLIDTNLERNICSNTGARIFAKIYLEFAAMNGKICLQSLLWNNLNLLPSQVSTIFQSISKNVLPEERVKLCYLLTFNIIISYIFPKHFIETHQVSQKLWIFTSSIWTIFVNFWVFTFTCYKKINDGSIYKIMSGVFWLEIILDRLLKD